MTRRRSSPHLADCGYCVLEGPDEFGNWDLIESWQCPFHGAAIEDEERQRWATDEEQEAA